MSTPRKFLVASFAIFAFSLTYILSGSVEAAPLSYDFRVPEASDLAGSSSTLYEAGGLPLQIDAGLMDQDGRFLPGEGRGAVLSIVPTPPPGGRGRGLGVLSEVSSLSFPEEGLSRREGLVFRFHPRFSPARFTLSGFTQGPDQLGEGAFEAVRVFVNGSFLADVPGAAGGMVTIPLPPGVATLAITPLLNGTPEIPMLSSDPVFFVASIEGISGVAAAFDIRPGSCDNPFNSVSRGVLPAALLGGTGLNVADIDLSSVRLAGVVPLRSSVEDVGAPVTGSCDDSEPDGIPDLTLKFNAQALLRAIRTSMGPLSEGQAVVLPLEARLKDGTPVAAEDVVILHVSHKQKKK